MDVKMDNVMANVAFDLREITPETPRLLSRAEYDRLVELGMFEDERVELLYGVIVKMSPIGPPHVDTVDRLNELFVLALHGRARVRTQGPLASSDDSEPEPDLAVVPLADYSTAHPEQAYLIIEVAQTSLRKDRSVKARLYAETGVREYWIVNLNDGVIEVHRKAQGGQYTDVSIVRRGESLTLESFPDFTVPVDKILRR